MSKRAPPFSLSSLLSTLQPNTLFSTPQLNGTLSLVFFTFQKNQVILVDLTLWILGVDVDLNSKMSWL